MKKICILKKDGGYWKEHGHMAYSKNILELYELIKDKDFEIVCGDDKDFRGKWKKVKDRI